MASLNSFLFTTEPRCLLHNSNGYHRKITLDVGGFMKFIDYSGNYSHWKSSTSSSPSSSSSSSSDEETVKYTVWMRSLVFHSNGCTIFDDSGNIVYRIDNYDTKCSSQVFLMDLKGKVLSTLIRKKLRVNENWIGYKNERVKNEKPWFKAKKITNNVFNKGDGFSCQVTIEGDESQALSCFTIQGCSQKSEFKIIRGDGLVVAQVKRKQSREGVMLGDDVLSLEVHHPNLDMSFIISLVVVHGLMSNRL